MLPRPILFISLLGASVAVPYALHKSPNWMDQLSGVFESGPSDNSVEVSSGLQPGDDPLSAQLTNEPGALLFPSAVPLEGFPSVQMEEVFRFDITKEWVYGRWPRKSTALARADLFGVRVPLVTGTNIDDVAGSLTYYFNPTGQVQHIAFHGRTGDTSKLVQLVTAYYGLQLQPPNVPGEQVFQIKWNGRVQSELRSRPSAVIWSSSPHTSFEVDLRLERPGSNRYLSTEVAL